MAREGPGLAATFVLKAFGHKIIVFADINAEKLAAAAATSGATVMANKFGQIRSE